LYQTQERQNLLNSLQLKLKLLIALFQPVDAQLTQINIIWGTM
jgi:hypothetical protein